MAKPNLISPVLESQYSTSLFLWSPVTSNPCECFEHLKSQENMMCLETHQPITWCFIYKKPPEFSHCTPWENRRRVGSLITESYNDFAIMQDLICTTAQAQNECWSSEAIYKYIPDHGLASKVDEIVHWSLCMDYTFQQSRTKNLLVIVSHLLETDAYNSTED